MKGVFSLIEKHKFCCTEMEQNITNEFLHYSDRFDEFGIPIHEDGLSIMLIRFCPWCGRKLPESQRMRWFEELEQLGYESPLFLESIPEAYKSARWRIQDTAPHEFP